ncbi:hypothetical protein BD769DRAFT_1390379 [Suillus cothurnatus]|nr:hypothetical protein BD769DRAFT_1390376 [Suillus cothurnatus]KAG2120175.1 hypothetical protein BD769DRAFT_1390379 [Suillus cothurnatus]
MTGGMSTSLSGSSQGENSHGHSGSALQKNSTHAEVFILKDSRFIFSKILFAVLMFAQNEQEAFRNLHILQVTTVLPELLSSGRKFSSISQSTRDHGMVTIKIVGGYQGDWDDLSSMQISRLTLIDLVGSERTKHTQATGDCIKEAGSINKSSS